MSANSFHRRYPRRFGLAILILAILALGENLHFLKKRFPPNFNFASRDSLSQYEGRYRGVDKFLPRRGIIGYLEEIPDNPSGFGHQFTQYALAPVLIKKGLSPRLVLNNNIKTLLSEEELKKQGLEIVFDANTGVRVLKRATP